MVQRAKLQSLQLHTEISGGTEGKVYQVAATAALEAVGGRRWMFMTLTFGLS